MSRNDVYTTTVFRLLESDYVTYTDGKRDCIRFASRVRARIRQSALKGVTFVLTGEMSARKIHRYRLNRVESIFDARLASFRYWYHSTNDNPDTVHRAIPRFSAVSIYARYARIPPRSAILRTRDRNAIRGCSRY